jgi:hypothetical protein
MAPPMPAPYRIWKPMSRELGVEVEMVKRRPAPMDVSSGIVVMMYQ